MSGADALHLLAATAALLLALLFGRQVVRALVGDALAVALGRPAEAAFGWLAGVTLLSIALGAAYAARAPRPGLLTGLVGLLVWAWLARHTHGKVGARLVAEPPPGAATRALLLVGWLLLGALVLAVGAASWRGAAGFPDAYQVWLLRGRVLFLDHGFSGRYFDAWRTAHDNRAYPPLLSLATAGLYEAMGGVDDRAAKLFSGACFAALLLVAHGALRRSLSRGAALVATLGLSACSTLVMVTVWGIADLPLAAHLLCGGVVLLAVDEPRAVVRLLALALLGAVLTKNEGLPAAIALLAGLALRLAWTEAGAAARGVASRLARLATAVVACALPALCGLGAWWALATARGLPLEFMLPTGGAHAASRLQRARLVASFTIQRLADPAWLPGFLAFAMVLVLLVARARRREAGRRAIAAALVVVLVALAYAWVLSGYEGDLPYLLRLSAGRLVAHLYPLALVTAASGIAALAAARD